MTVIQLLLDTGEWPMFTPPRRVQLGRCVRCEWHVATQGHHPYCPDLPTARTDTPA